MRPVANPPNPFAAHSVEYDEDAAPDAKLELFEERARAPSSAKNDSPDVGFRYSVNPYRGCIHGCAYCYARPLAPVPLGFGAGTDFDRKIAVKINAPDVLRDTFERRSWKGDLVIFSGNTDCYQPIERSYELTRRCLEVCADFRNPVGIITKSTLVLRDLALLQRLRSEASVSVWVSIAFDSDEDGLALDPWAPRPSRRFDVIRALAAAGIPVGVSASPVIFGLNDAQIPSVLERAREAGATRAFSTLLRLPSPPRRSVRRARRQEPPAARPAHRALAHRAARRQEEQQPVRRSHGGRRSPVGRVSTALRPNVRAARDQRRRERSERAARHLSSPHAAGELVLSAHAVRAASAGRRAMSALASDSPSWPIDAMTF
jgi:DNA repair photolyase